MFESGLLTFYLLIFAASFLVFLALAMPAGGPSARDIRQLRKRIEELSQEEQAAEETSLLRDKYRQELNAFDRLMIRIPGLENHLDYSRQTESLREIRTVFILSGITGLALAMVIWFSGGEVIVAVAVAVCGLVGPFVSLRIRAMKKLQEFESQLPEALDAITRALRAGYAFMDCLRLVAREIDAPLGTEFRIVFDEINGGIDMRSAFISLLKRVPSVSLMAFTTAVILQRETGGNLSETLQKISVIIRNRFSFQRNIQTLTAEARMSAWVLAALPFVLFIVVFVVNPDYALVLVREEAGRKMLLAGLGLMIFGSFWLRRIIRIEA